jgi:hypothetical protein
MELAHFDSEVSSQASRRASRLSCLQQAGGRQAERMLRFGEFLEKVFAPRFEVERVHAVA